jgi:hypothetical protein
MALRLVRELHKELMDQARSTQYSAPGQFRTSQNWIGGTHPDNARFVPPPPTEMLASLGELEKFIIAEDNIPMVPTPADDHVTGLSLCPVKYIAVRGSGSFGANCLR